MNYTVNTVNGSSSGGTVGIADNFSPPNPSNAGDVLQSLGSSSFTSISGSGNLDYQLRFLDTDAVALSNDSLPLNASFFSGGAFSGINDQATLSLFGSNGLFSGLSGQSTVLPQFGPLALVAVITSLTSETGSAVSEPAIIVLFGLGVAGLAVANRRKKRKATTA